MEKIILDSVYFNKLKGLNNVNIKFSDTLTAIMGVNGSGKTTVIHALACLYQPDGNGENHKFPEFFVPNTDALWKGSNLNVVNKKAREKADREPEVMASKCYCKKEDRWSPRYDTRPKRNVYYIGIDTCLPEIEKRNTNSRIMYKSSDLDDNLSRKIIETSAYILNKDYDKLVDNSYNKTHLTGVKLKTGLKYSSLSMGSGEQRVIKIIDVILRAEAYSLILIDEIDLLLHVSALNKLIERIYDIAKNKHIQVVFTTHSIEMLKLTKYVFIQYITNFNNNDNTLVYEKITPDLIYNMTGERSKTLTIYVEDELAKQVVKQIIIKNDMFPTTDVITYGSIENAFTLAASFVISNDQNLSNKLIVLDGDRYQDNKEKLKQINKKLSGSEPSADDKRQKALGLITEFKLPEECAPEKFIHDLILRNLYDKSECKGIYNAANEIKSVLDSHEWINEICNRLTMSVSDIINYIFHYLYDDEKCKNYIKPIEDWILNHKS